MTVNASSIHVIGNSNAFPNFRTGAVDNSYAYAHAHVDGSPFAQGRSSPLDIHTFGYEPRDYLLSHRFVPDDVRTAWETVVNLALEGVERAGIVAFGDHHVADATL